MRILLFDWYSGGHHELYLAEFTRALRDRHVVVAASPPAGATAAAEAGAEPLALEDPFPLADTSRRFSQERRAALRREVELLRDAVRVSGADHALHLFADGALRGLVGRSVGAPLSVLLFRPRYHLAALSHRRRQPREWMQASAYEAIASAWRQSRGAHAVLTLDPLAAAQWSMRRGAPVFALPEPAVRFTAPSSGTRQGAALVGALSERKGIRHVVAALEDDGRDVRLVLAGVVYPNYAPTMALLVERLRAAGVDVDLRAGYQEEAVYFDALARARVVLLPYVGHVGMSRVLVEAATAGTPVIAHEEGLVGHLVRTHALGLTVDCQDPQAFAEAIHKLTNDSDAVADYGEALREFAAAHTPERFAAAVRAPFEPTFTKRPSNWRRRPVAGS